MTGFRGKIAPNRLNVDGPLPPLAERRKKDALKTAKTEDP
jgi:hypothetical protein